MFALRECSPLFACTKADVSPPNDEFDHIRRERGATFGQDTKEPIVHLVKVGQVGQDIVSGADRNRLVPFATNMQIQVLSCSNTNEEDQVRMILNDAVVPLTGLNGCPDDEQGLCPLATFVSALQTLIGEVDFAQECGVVGTSE